MLLQRTNIEFRPRKVIIFTLPIFFVFLADAMLSYIFPIAVESAFHSHFILGLIMSLSSLAGICCDFLFPLVFQKRSWRFMLLTGSFLALLFPVLTTLGSVYAAAGLFITASIIWGVYYEFLTFSEQIFIIAESKKQNYSQDWSLIYLLVQVSRIIGPVLGAYIIASNDHYSTLSVMVFQAVGICLAWYAVFTLKDSKNLVKAEPLPLKFMKEAYYWRKLGRRVLPVIINTVTLVSVDALIATLGALFAIELFKGQASLDWLIIFIHSLAWLLSALILSRLVIPKGKKRISNTFLMLAGIILSLIELTRDPYLTVFIIFCACFFFAFSGPLNEAVFSDLLQRLGKNQVHLLGMSRMNASLSYIIAPVFVGFLADWMGYRSTFAMMGLIAALIGLILMLVTPTKLRLPQSEFKD